MVEIEERIKIQEEKLKYLTEQPETITIRRGIKKTKRYIEKLNILKDKVHEFVVGRVCKKTMSAEKDRICVVVDDIDRTYVLVDGDVRRKRCNKNHLEPIDDMVDIKAGASREEVQEKLREKGYTLVLDQKKSNQA